jgi:hypothetical protein
VASTGQFLYCLMDAIQIPTQMTMLSQGGMNAEDPAETPFEGKVISPQLGRAFTVDRQPPPEHTTSRRRLCGKW